MGQRSRVHSPHARLPHHMRRKAAAPVSAASKDVDAEEHVPSTVPRQAGRWGEKGGVSAVTRWLWWRASCRHARNTGLHLARRPPVVGEQRVSGVEKRLVGGRQRVLVGHTAMCCHSIVPGARGTGRQATILRVGWGPLLPSSTHHTTRPCGTRARKCMHRARRKWATAVAWAAPSRGDSRLISHPSKPSSAARSASRRAQVSSNPSGDSTGRVAWAGPCVSTRFSCLPAACSVITVPRAGTPGPVRGAARHSERGRGQGRRTLHRSPHRGGGCSFAPWRWAALAHAGVGGDTNAWEK